MGKWLQNCLDANMVLSDEQRKIARESGIRVESIGRANEKYFPYCLFIPP